MRNFSGRGEPRDIVHDDQERGPEQGRSRDQPPVVIAEQHPAEMRDDKADPADHAGDRDGCCRQQPRAEDDGESQQAGIHAHRARLLLAERQQVHAPAQDQQRHEPERDRDHKKQHIPRLDGGKAAHQPVGNGRELLLRVGDELEIGRARRKERRDHHAGQNEGNSLVRAAHAADKIGRRNCQKAEHEGRRRNAEIACAEQDGQRRAEARAGRRAENVRRDHGVPEHALIGHARDCQRRADEGRRRNAREADLEHDVLRAVPPARLRLGQAGEQQAEQLLRRDGKAPEQHGAEQCRHKDGPQHGKAAGIGVVLQFHGLTFRFL